MVPQVEETLAGYRSPESSTSLEKPTLHTKPCRLTSTLVGNIFQAAGGAGATLRTMVVFQVYQADLLKDLSMGRGIFRATPSHGSVSSRKQPVPSAVLWLLWRDICGLTSWVPMSPSSIFGNSINTVVNRFREAKKHREAFRGTRFLPRGTQTIGM